MSDKKPEPLFGQYAGATLKRCEAVFRQRGSQYSDTMRECQFLMMRAVATELGLAIPDKYLRVLCIASFADMKYARLLGGYKEDTLEDGINYSAFVAEELRQIKEGTAEKSACNFGLFPLVPIDVAIENAKREAEKIVPPAPGADFSSHPGPESPKRHPYECRCPSCRIDIEIHRLTGHGAGCTCVNCGGMRIDYMRGARTLKPLTSVAQDDFKAGIDFLTGHGYGCVCVQCAKLFITAKHAAEGH